MKTTALAITTAAALLSTTANAAVLATWDGVAGASQPVKNLALGVTGTDLTRGAGIGAASGGNFNSSGFDTSSTTLVSAIAADDYLSFGITGNVDLDSILVELDSSSSGPDTVYLTSSLDSFATALGTFATPDPGAILTFDLTGLPEVDGAIEFRFYFSGASNSGGTTDIEDDLIDSNDTGLVINGTVVPEPGSLALLGLGSLLIARRRRG